MDASGWIHSFVFALFSLVFYFLFFGSSGVQIVGKIAELDSFVRWLYAAFDAQ
jgi:hypothetical protein